MTQNDHKSRYTSQETTVIQKESKNFDNNSMTSTQTESIHLKSFEKLSILTEPNV